MEGDTKETLVKRLNYIEGHLSGVRKMIEEDRYCVDVIKQTHAIRRAIQKMESMMIDGHLRTCVADAYRDGRDDQMVSELRELYEIAERT